MGVYVERSPRQEDWKYWGKKSVAGVANFVNCLWLSCGKAEQLLTLCHFLSLKKICSFSSTVLVLNLEIPCENPTPNAAHTLHFGDKHCCQLKVYCLIFSQSVLFKIFISIFPLYIFFSQKSFLTESWQKVPFPSWPLNR